VPLGPVLPQLQAAVRAVQDDLTASYRTGARRAVPLAIAVGAFGISFGVLARAAGMGVWAPLAFSAATFAGSAQFAAVSVLNDRGGLAAAIAAAVLLNVRYVPIGISIARGFTGGQLRRLAEAQLVVDESWAISIGGTRFDRRLLVGAGLAIYAAWLGGTAVGVVGGGIVGDPRRYGLDAAFPALFLALLAPRLRDRRALVAALIGGSVAAALIPVARPGIPIIAASLGCLVGARR
jgi:predicted branched-subunit amino acid permease